MKDIWYSDNRDLVKWSVLLKLAEINQMDRILQIAYYRDSGFDEIQIDGMNYKIPDTVLQHFRRIQNIRKLKSNVKISIFDEYFEDRDEYHNKVIGYLSKYRNYRCIVFLDPDTGLQPPKSKARYQHVLNDEVRMIWDGMKVDDILVFYQHGGRNKKVEWKEPKRKQFASAIGVDEYLVKVADSNRIAHDVSFYYCLKSIS